MCVQIFTNSSGFLLGYMYSPGHALLVLPSFLARSHWFAHSREAGFLVPLCSSPLARVRPLGFHTSGLWLLPGHGWVNLPTRSRSCSSPLSSHFCVIRCDPSQVFPSFLSSSYYSFPLFLCLFLWLPYHPGPPFEGDPASIYPMAWD